ncbi:MAG: cobyrinate a,c-diamide synthase [Paenibacillaceae bacterium]
MMSERRLVVAGTGSGVGKTTATISLMAAFKQQGLQVQGFKCGPDYIDPTYHSAVTGRPSRNLDSWMFSEQVLREVLYRGSRNADLSIIEGVMGFFDGKEATSLRGSTAEISKLTDTPVLLIVDCGGMARSAAAVVKGFQLFEKDIRFAGVIANRVGSEGHYHLVKEAVEEACGIPVFGYLQKVPEIELPERHLGLVPSVERGDLDALFGRMGELAAQTIDLQGLLKATETSPAVNRPTGLFQPKASYPVRIAVARDAAFHFYYEENLELLRAYGAELIFFSPLSGEVAPQSADGLYIGGGFPEEFASELAGQLDVLQSLKAAVREGKPVFAECGGFMLLTERMIQSDGSTHSMAGIIPGEVRMQHKLAALGYREISGLPGNFLLSDRDRARGHEYHYSTFHPYEEIKPAYHSKGLRKDQPEGYAADNVIAGYTHIHFASCPSLVERWLNRCLEWRRSVK